MDRAASRERNRVERAINRLKQYRAVATRDDTLATTSLAIVTIAMILERLSLCSLARSGANGQGKIAEGKAA